MRSAWRRLRRASSVGRSATRQRSMWWSMIRSPAWSRLLRAAINCVTTSSQTRSSSSMRWMPPIVEELADEYSGKVIFYKINTDDNVQTASKYGIRSIPTLLVFKDGQIVDQLIGFRPKSDLKRSLEKALS